MTPDANYYLDLLIAIAEELEILYYELAISENKGHDSFTTQYNYYLKQIIDNTIKENSILTEAITNGYQEELNTLLNDLLKGKRETKLLLLNSDAYLFRIRNMLECLSGDETLDYVYTIKYDINKILFQFLEALIKNPHYAKIKKILTIYKYSLYYGNIDSENSLMEGEEYTKRVKLESATLRPELPFAKYIDKALLTLECNYSIMNLDNYSEDLEEDIEDDSYISNYAKAVIDIINILARLTICPEEEMNHIYHDLMLIIEDETLSPDLKDTIHDMIEILGNIKDKFTWTRRLNL